MGEGLNRAIPASAAHLCVDMQRLFAEDTPWRTPWMDRVAPAVARLCDHRPERTWFTRFVPPARPDDSIGGWKPYWTKWEDMTLDRLDPELVGLIPALAAFTPPAQVFDKPVYSPWWDGRLRAALLQERAATLVVSGGETDVCVLATVIGAVDLGFRVILATDALCSSADDVHDAALRLYHDRFGLQVETAETEAILDAWR